MDFYDPLSKECVDALNQAVAYHLHISYVYLGMVSMDCWMPMWEDSALL